MKKNRHPRTAAARSPAPAAAQVDAPWTFLTNHAHVLWCIYRQPEVRLREMAPLVGITERMVQKIVNDLAAAGYIQIEKLGRRNAYRLSADRPLRHPLEAHCQVGQLLELLGRTHSASGRRGRSSS